MSDDAEEFNFDDADVDLTGVALDEMAKLMVPMFRAFRLNGLSVREAAALTAAYVANVSQKDSTDDSDN